MLFMCPKIQPHFHSSQALRVVLATAGLLLLAAGLAGAGLMAAQHGPRHLLESVAPRLFGEKLGGRVAAVDEGLDEDDEPEAAPPADAATPAAKAVAAAAAAASALAAGARVLTPKFKVITCRGPGHEPG
jgi:hypothetical protein